MGEDAAVVDADFCSEEDPVLPETKHVTEFSRCRVV